LPDTESPETESKLDWAKLSAARLRACDQWPYFSTGLLALHVVESPGIGTFAVDKNWRLFIDPEALDRWTVDQAAVVLNHELQHLLREHADRAARLGITYEDRFAWNLAADAEINDDLFDNVAPDVRKSLPGVTPQSLKQEPGLMAEVYFQNIEARQSDGFDEGSGVHGFPGGPTPELPDDEVGVSPAEASILRRGIASEVRHYGSRPGQIGAGLERWANATLGLTQDWRVLLAARVRQSISHVAGLADYSYRRVSRRSGSASGIVFPAMVKPEASIAVVVDTSGSVDDALLGDAMRELAVIVRTVGQRGAKTHVVACDAAAARPAVLESGRSGAMKLMGGGGTDMRVGIAAALEIVPRPTSVVVLTDGFSPWPRERPAVPIVVGLLGRSSSRSIPDWAITVQIES